MREESWDGGCYCGDYEEALCLEFGLHPERKQSR
jgi:hypothetical protein